MILLVKYNRCIYLPILVLLILVGGCAGPARRRPAQRVAPPPEKLDEMAFHHFSNGTILMLDENYAAATVELEKALMLEPDSREIRVSLGECYFQLREIDKAVTVVYAISPKDTKVWSMLARYYRLQNRGDETYRAYQEVLKLDPDDVNAHWFLAQLEMRRGNTEAAIEQMERVTELRLSARMMTELGSMYWRAGQTDRAIKILRDVTDGTYGSAPRNAFGLLADIYKNLGQSDEWASILRRGKDLFPQYTPFQQQLVDALIEASLYEEAVGEVEALLRRRPSAQYRIKLAGLYFELGRYPKSDSLFMAVAEMNPEEYVPQLYLGRLRVLREEYDSAKAYLARAVEINDEIPEAYWRWANALIAQDSVRKGIEVAREGEFIAQPKAGLQFLIGLNYSRLQVYDSAVFWLEKARLSEPSDLRVGFSLGAAYERNGRFRDADSVFKAVIAVDSNFAGALNYLGYMYADSGINLDVSLRLIERAVEIDPDNGAYLDSYAWVLYRLGRFEEAEVQIRKAIEYTDPEDPVVYDHYGDILARLGYDEQALEQWTNALALDPDNEAIKEKLGSPKMQR